MLYIQHIILHPFCWTKQVNLFENAAHEWNWACTRNILKKTVGKWRGGVGLLDEGCLSVLVFESLTMVAQNEEAAATEVAVELNKDLVRSAIHRLQSCVSTKLSNLW